MMRIGIDLGGTKIEGIVMDSSGATLVQRRIATPSREGYDAIVSGIVGLTKGLELEAGVPCSIGVGTPGAVSRLTGAMKNSNTRALNGRALARDLETALARPVKIENDANCFALSEAKDGAGAGYRVVFGVIVGTGVGGGVVVDGKIHNGPNGIAGEWGHTPLIANGEACYCGRSGCVETVLSGPGFAADYARSGGDATLDAHGITSRARDGEDSCAVAALDRYFARFGRALATVIDILDPDIVVLGGGMSNIDGLYVGGAREVAANVFSDELRTPIVRNQYGDASGVRGAAMLWEPLDE
jgi:fructokinase